MRTDKMDIPIEARGCVFVVPLDESSRPNWKALEEPHLSILLKQWDELGGDRQNELISQAINDFKSTVPAPDWNRFNAELIQDSVLNEVISAALSKAPIVAITFPAALAQAPLGFLSNFNTIFRALVETTGISREQRERWVELANSCNLPQVFINSLRAEY